MSLFSPLAKVASVRSTSSRVSTSRMAASSWRAALAQPVAGAGPAIVVGIVDGADDMALAHDRGRLQIVAGDAQAHDIEQVLRFLA